MYFTCLASLPWCVFPVKCRTTFSSLHSHSMSLHLSRLRKKEIDSVSSFSVHPAHACVFFLALPRSCTLPPSNPLYLPVITSVYRLLYSRLYRWMPARILLIRGMHNRTLFVPKALHDVFEDMQLFTHFLFCFGQFPVSRNPSEEPTVT